MTSRKQKIDLIRDRLKDEPIDRMRYTGYTICDKGIYHALNENCSIIKNHAIFCTTTKSRILNGMLYDREAESLFRFILAMESPILYEIYEFEKTKVKR